MAASIDFENILVFVDTVWNDDMDIIFISIWLVCGILSCIGHWRRGLPFPCPHFQRQRLHYTRVGTLHRHVCRNDFWWESAADSWHRTEERSVLPRNHSM